MQRTAIHQLDKLDKDCACADCLMQGAIVARSDAGQSFARALAYLSQGFLAEGLEQGQPAQALALAIATHSLELGATFLAIHRIMTCQQPVLDRDTFQRLAGAVWEQVAPEIEARCDALRTDGEEASNG
jgi:hypothetical protein